MIYPTIAEILVLWALLCLIGGFFIGYKIVFIINVLITTVIVILITIGFILEVGAELFRLIFNL